MLFSPTVTINQGHTSFMRLNHFPAGSAKHAGVANHGHTGEGAGSGLSNAALNAAPCLAAP